MKFPFKKKKKFSLQVVDVLAKYVSGQCVPGDDVDDAVWVDKEEYENLNVHKETDKLISLLKCFD